MALLNELIVPLGLRPLEIRMTLAPVRPFGHVPRLFRVIFRSFHICYFSTVLLMSFLSLTLSFHVSVGEYNELGSWPSAWNIRFLMPFLWAPLIIFQCLIASLIGQSCSFALLAAIGGTRIALLSKVTLTDVLQWSMLPSPGLEEPSSGQSHNLLT